MSDSQNKCFCCKFNVSYHYLRPSGKNKEIWPFIAYDQPYGAHQASLSKTITPLKWNIIEYAKSRFSWASLVAQLVRIHLQCRRLGFDSWVWKIPWRRDRLPTPVFLGFPCGSAGKEYACKAGDEQETQVQSLGGKDPLEKGKATHSSSLAWRIPWTEEPGGLQSMGSQRLGHDWAYTRYIVSLTRCFT